MNNSNSTSDAEEQGTYNFNTKESLRLFKEASKTAPLGVQGDARFFAPHPIYISKAEGARLHDVDGNEYIDYWAAAGPIILGHSHLPLIDAIDETMRTMGTLYTLPHPREVELARRLCELVPSAEKVVYGCGGSDVLAFALRAARAYTGRNKFLKFEGSYNGWHDATLFSVRPPLQEAGPIEAPIPVPGSSGLPPEAAENIFVMPYNDIAATERLLKEKGREIAAIVVEPILHTPGCIMPKPGFLEYLREAADTYGIVLIFDEIITGIRHSLGGAQKILGVTPDLTALGKAISNGFPFSALVGRDKIMSVLTPQGSAYYSGTYMGFLLSVTACLVTLDALEDGTVHKKIADLGDTLSTGINDIARQRGIPMRCQNYGSIWAVYFTKRKVTTYRELLAIDFPRAKLDLAFRHHLLSQGVYFHPGTARAYFYDAHTESDLDRTLTAVESFVESHASLLQKVA